MNNILLLTRAPIKETNGVGNTFSNFFGGFNKSNIYNLYCRNDLPENSICNEYYQITEKSIIGNLFTTSEVGNVFSLDEANELKNRRNIISQIKKENIMLDYFRKNRSALFLFARDLLWSIGNWRDEKLKFFLLNNRIDVIYVLVSDCQYLYYLLDYCKKITKAKIVLFFSDDTYSHLSFTPAMYLYKLGTRKKIRKAVDMASLIYGASSELCEEYGQIFNRSIEPLYKGCDFSGVEVKTYVNNPIIISYAGNMLYGRDKVLSMLAKEIKKIKHDNYEIRLHIYTQAIISEALNQELNIEGASVIMGGVPYNQIIKILNDSDIVLHVESNENKQKKLTRLSFSTKIIDCMQSGSCMLAIGPDEVASMQYIISKNIGFVAINPEEINQVLQKIISDPSVVLKKAKEMKAFAERNHSISDVQVQIMNDIKNI